MNNMTPEALEALFISGKMLTQADLVVWRDIDRRLRREQAATEWVNKLLSSDDEEREYFGNNLLAAMLAAEEKP
jgi:hypothetical protein